VTRAFSWFTVMFFNLYEVGVVKFNATDTICFGGGHHSQSLEWYWQTKQCVKIDKINTIYNANSAKYRTTWSLWFGGLLLHSSCVQYTVTEKVAVCSCTSPCCHQITLLVYHKIDQLPPLPTTTFHWSLTLHRHTADVSKTISVSVASSDQPYWSLL